MFMSRTSLLVLAAALLLSGCATAGQSQDDWPVYTLEHAQVFPLETTALGQFDASALLRTRAGDLLTLSDSGPTLYRIELPSSPSPARVVALTNLFTREELAPFVAEKIGRYDCEGIAEDDAGRLYICEEANRWILRYDPKGKYVERLSIDWSPVTNYFSIDRNASFEGIAIGSNKLYVANERLMPRIIVVDLRTLKIIEDFVVNPRTVSLLGLHYSDLCWFDAKLYVLCRQHYVVLEVEPETHRVLAEFDYKSLEDRLGYRKDLPVGFMEGLSVDRDNIWLAIDNNGYARKRDPNDIRPVLLKCPRPDRH
jgi:uncharacterized protein YjiK